MLRRRQWTPIGVRSGDCLHRHEEGRWHSQRQCLSVQRRNNDINLVNPLGSPMKELDRASRRDFLGVRAHVRTKLLLGSAMHVGPIVAVGKSQPFAPEMVGS